MQVTSQRQARDEALQVWPGQGEAGSNPKVDGGSACEHFRGLARALAGKLWMVCGLQTPDAGPAAPRLSISLLRSFLHPAMMEHFRQKKLIS